MSAGIYKLNWNPQLFFLFFATNSKRNAIHINEEDFFMYCPSEPLLQIVQNFIGLKN